MQKLETKTKDSRQIWDTLTLNSQRYGGVQGEWWGSVEGISIADDKTWQKTQILPYKQIIVAYHANIKGLPAHIAYDKDVNIAVLWNYDSARTVE